MTNAIARLTERDLTNDELLVLREFRRVKEHTAKNPGTRGEMTIKIADGVMVLLEISLTENVLTNEGSQEKVTEKVTRTRTIRR